MSTREQRFVADRILKRVYLLFGLFTVFGGVVVWRIVHLQTTQRDRWMAVQQKERVYYRKVLADRGTIYARDGSILAITLPFYRIALDVTAFRRRDIPNFDDSLDVLCKQLSRRYGDAEINSQYLKNKIRKAMRDRDRHVYLFPYQRTFNHQEMAWIRQQPILNRGRFKGGLIVEKISNKRFHPFQGLAQVTLGMVRDDTFPFRGLEYSFQHLLRGKDGLALVQRIPGGIEVPIGEDETVQARDGYDLHTTLDVHLQDVAEDALRKTVLESEAKGGTVILMEVQTGAIRAIANYPQSFNTGVVSSLEPGSTFKLATLAALIDEGYVKPNDMVETGNGSATFYDVTVKDTRGHGTISVQEAFEQSSNVAMAKLVRQHYGKQPSAFIRKLEDMGALTPVGAQLKGEPTPYVIRPGSKAWSGPTLPLLSFGYNVQLTPLQLLAFYNAIANDGKMIQPILVREVRSGSEAVASFEPTVLREQIVKPSTLRILRQMMEGVVQNGTAKNIQSAHYTIAGKTGTAKKLVNGVYQQKYRASFAGYFPADKPRYSCFVMIDEPSTGEYYGAQLAAPVFRRIADNLYATDRSQAEDSRFAATSIRRLPEAQRLALQDAKAVYGSLGTTLIEPKDADFVETHPDGRRVVARAVKLPVRTVPDVRGMSARDALALLENRGCCVALSGHGKVRSQSVAPGTKLRENIPVTLELN